MEDKKSFGPDIFDVSGKIVLITGAGSGLGAGYAVTFGKYGAVVACAGRNMERLENTVCPHSHTKICVFAYLKNPL